MPRIKEIRVPGIGGMNLDADYKLIAKDASRETINLRSFFTDEGKSGTKQKFLGNEIVLFTPNSGKSYECVGIEPDYQENTIYFFIRPYDVNNDVDMILRYNVDTDTVDAIMEHSILNFHGYVHANVIDGLLYWTDGYDTAGFQYFNYNPPRKINIQKAYNWTNNISGNALERYFPNGGETDEKIFNLIDAIKHPPTKEPSLLKGTHIAEGKQLDFDEKYGGYANDENTNSNLLRGTLWQFRYRYVYDDNEKSTWSPISRLPIPLSDQYPGGYYKPDLWLNNVIGIQLETGSNEVRLIEVAARQGNIGSWNLIDRLEKYDTEGTVLIDSFTSYNFLFYNNRLSYALDQQDTNRLFDFVPQVAKHQEIIEDNRLLYGRYTEGYDNLNIDVELEARHQKIEVYGINEEITVDHNITRKWKFDSGNNAYYIILRMEGGNLDIGGNFKPGVVYIITAQLRYMHQEITGPHTLLDSRWVTLSYLVKEGDTVDDVGKYFEEKFTEYTGGYTPENIYEKAVYYPPMSGITGNEDPKAGYLYFKWSLEGPADRDIYYWEAEQVRIYAFSDVEAYQTFKSGTHVEFALAYYDRANRSSAAQISSSTTLSIPYQTELVENGWVDPEDMFHRFDVYWKIRHQPPAWATHYQWLIGRPTISYYLDFGVPKGNIYTDNDEVAILLNQGLEVMKDGIRKTNIDYYQWEKGDRIRFYGIRDTNTGRYRYWDKYLDLEVIGIDYLNDEDNDFGYLTDDTYGDDKWIRDEIGNKVRNPVKMILLVEYFDIEGLDESDTVDNVVGGKQTKSIVGGKLPTTANQHESIAEEGEEFERIYLVEVYRPTKEADEKTKIFYEFGETYEIGDPHTENRYHKKGEGGSFDQDYKNNIPASGIFQTGNAYIFFRVSGIAGYPVESEWFSDWFDSQVTSQGRINAINLDMQRRLLYANLRFGGIYIQDGNKNDLSTFRAADFISLKKKFGSINIMREKGTLLRIIQRYKVSSIYLGKAGLKLAQSEGTGAGEILASTDDVLGTRYESVESYGSEHPYSYVQSPSFEYYVDINNGVIIQHSTNGQRAISRESAVNSEVKELCSLLRGSSYQTVRIISGYNEDFDEVYFTFYGSKYPADDPRADQESRFAKTLVYSEKHRTFYSFVEHAYTNTAPEMYANLGDTLISIMSGQVYKHNIPGKYNEFYGQQKEASIKLIFNEQPFKDKIYKALIVDGEGNWQASETADVMVIDEAGVNAVSRVKFEKFEKKHGVYYAPFGKNMKTKSNTPTVNDLINGSDLRGTFLILTLRENSATQASLRAVVVESIISELSG